MHAPPRARPQGQAHDGHDQLNGQTRRGLNRLQRAGTLPSVWIPSSGLCDWRDLPRTRMVLVRQRTRLKNRMHAGARTSRSGEETGLPPARIGSARMQMRERSAQRDQGTAGGRSGCVLG